MILFFALLLELEWIPRRNKSVVFILELREHISFVWCGLLSQGSNNKLIGSVISSPECPCLSDFLNLCYVLLWWMIAGILHTLISKKNDLDAIYVKEKHQLWWLMDLVWVVSLCVIHTKVSLTAVFFCWVSSQQWETWYTIKGFLEVLKGITVFRTGEYVCCDPVMLLIFRPDMSKCEWDKTATVLPSQEATYFEISKNHSCRQSNILNIDQV